MPSRNTHIPHHPKLNAAVDELLEASKATGVIPQPIMDKIDELRKQWYEFPSTQNDQCIQVLLSDNKQHITFNLQGSGCYCRRCWSTMEEGLGRLYCMALHHRLVSDQQQFADDN